MYYPYQPTRQFTPQVNFQPYQQPMLYNQPQYNNQVTIPQISGRIVNNIAEVTANEVPMDGNQSLFPLTDKSCIYAKSWGADGTIKTTKYILEVPEGESEDSKDGLYEMVSKRLDQFETLLTNKNNSKTRKEVTEDVQSK